MTDLAGVTHTYEYDANGNITKESYGGLTNYYFYDSQNRLIRAHDAAANRIYVYTYDNRGNILTRKTTAGYATPDEWNAAGGEAGVTMTTHTNTYGDGVWADLLTNIGGYNITYDELGNPLNWNSRGTSLEWDGHKLTKFKRSSTSYNYEYNADGLRTKKYTTNSSGSVTKSTEYYIVDGTYIGETTTINGTKYVLSYFYDENGSPAGIWLGNSVYYFAKNLQGDVTAIFDYAGNVLAKYRYDAYGAIISVTDANGNNISSATHIAHLNPFRYRGYMYDEESGFYYLRSRYYDPYIGRFINADGLVSTGQGLSGNNMFAYCGNNPVMRADTSGDFWRIVVGIIATVAVGIAVVKKVNKRLKEKNYEHNAKIDNNKDTTTHNKYIYNQKAAPIDSFEFGVSNASATSCEAVAVHNVKVHHGIESTLTNTIEDIQNNDGMCLLGMWGSNYYTLDTVLEDYGFTCTAVGLNEMTTPGTYIISYWDYGPIHTIGVVYDGTNYYAWNTGTNWRNNDDSKMDKINPQTDYRWRYLYGYLVE